ARSMYIPGSIAQWEAWTGLTFPGSGEYVVPGGLAPVRVDRERDRAEYLEPNVWMRHRLT
ncbi:MAG TPA: transferase, partial [candidate division Zixibacteria bacterium]|nr:transferase [candidate division Zixibacteria bacterium]